MAWPSPALYPSPGLRLRPGERPGWWHAGADREHFAAWRRAAAAHGLAVDALVATLVELHLVRADLRAAGADPLALLRGAVREPDGLGRLPPTPALRAWSPPPGRVDATDELPELVLPERLIARLPPGTALAGRVDLDQAALAVEADRRAAADGRTLESWALRAALLADARAGEIGQLRE